MKDAFRFSIRHLLLWTAAVGLFCLALKNASPTWFAASFALVLVLLAAGGLLVVFRRGAVQAWWIGFVACGGLYVVMLMYGWSSEGSNPLRPDRVATGRISRWTCEKVYPWIKADVPDSPADAFATAGGRDTFMVVTPQRPPPGPYQGDFVNVAHAFWTLLLAACGGTFARWLYRTMPGSSA